MSAQTPVGRTPFSHYWGPAICWIVLYLCGSFGPEPSRYVALFASMPFAGVLVWRLLRDSFSDVRR